MSKDIVEKLVDSLLEQGPPSESGGKIGNEDKSKEEVEEMFPIDTPEEKVEKHVDFLIDMCGVPHHKSKKEDINECGGEDNQVQNTPSQDPEEELSRVHADITGPVEPDDTEDEYPPGPEGPYDDMFGGDLPMEQKVEKILGEEDYKTFFKSMIDKEGISNIKDLSPEKKKAFFNQVDAAWKAKKETD